MAYSALGHPLVEQPDIDIWTNIISTHKKKQFPEICNLREISIKVYVLFYNDNGLQQHYLQFGLYVLLRSLIQSTIH